jgi:hypothetical protein
MAISLAGVARFLVGNDVGAGRLSALRIDFGPYASDFIAGKARTMSTDPPDRNAQELSLGQQSQCRLGRINCEHRAAGEFFGDPEPMRA